MWWWTLPGWAPSDWIRAPRSTWCAAGGPRDGGAPEVVLTQFWLNKPEMGPGFGWDSVAAPMGGHRVAALAILMVALGVGTLGAVAVWRRLGRLPGERGRIPGVDQHVRTLRPQPESPTLGG